MINSTKLFIMLIVLSIVLSLSTLIYNNPLETTQKQSQLIGHINNYTIQDNLQNVGDTSTIYTGEQYDPPSINVYDLGKIGWRVLKGIIAPWSIYEKPTYGMTENFTYYLYYLIAYFHILIYIILIFDIYFIFRNKKVN